MSEEIYLTSNDDLVRLMIDKNSKIDSFVDSRRKNTLNPGFNIFDENRLPRKIRKSEIGIIFIDEINGVGHWVSYANFPGLKYIYYIDPLAHEASNKIKKYLESSGKKIIALEKAIQDVDSTKCGYYAVDLLSDINKLKRKNDKSVVKILHQYKFVNDGINDKNDVEHNESKVLDDVLNQD